MSVDDGMLPKDLATYIPRALEILTLYRLGEYQQVKAVVEEYPLDEVRLLLRTVAAVTAGLFEVAYGCTDLPEEEWLPHFSVGLTGMFLDD